MKAVGRKTAISVNEVAMTASPISSAASRAASSGRLPIARWRMMFSISTMASSTRMPTTSDSDSSVTTLTEKPIQCITAKVGIADSGSATAETRVARHSRRKAQTTSTASKRAFEQQRHRALVVLDHRIDEVEGFGDGHVGVRRLQLGQRLDHAVGNVDLAGAARARDLEADHRLAIEQRGRAALARRRR